MPLRPLGKAHFAVFGATFILGLAYVRFSSGRASYRPVQQPFAFNHYVHTHNPDKPVECSGCHRGVETSYHATLPGIEVCSSCHLEPKGDTEKEKQFIAEYVDNEKPLPWQRLFVLPDHAFFSHRLHVVRGAIECQTCHGPMDMRTSPPPSAAPRAYHEHLYRLSRGASGEQRLQHLPPMRPTWIEETS